MSPGDRSAFKRSLLLTASVYRREMSDALIGRYFAHLERYELAEVERALFEIEETPTTYFPVPGQIIEMIRSARRSQTQPKDPQPEISEEARARNREQARGIVRELEERLRVPEEAAEL